MKKTIKTYKYEKIEVSNSEIEIPEEPMYVFQTGIRRAIRIVPKWTTWNKEHKGTEEEIYELECTCVYNSFDCKVEMFKISISGIEDMINAQKKDHYSIPDMLKDKDYNIRTKERFEEDLKVVLNKIGAQELIEPVKTED